MTICKQCGVELDDGVQVCPLCETSVSGHFTEPVMRSSRSLLPERPEKHLLQQIIWQITAVLLLSGIVATLIINLSIHKTITWAIYPVSICLVIFSYAALMALWRVKFPLQMIVGWILSTAILIGVSYYVVDEWPLKVSFPLLTAVNFLILLLHFIVRRIDAKGLNILAIVCVAVAVLCLFVEGVLSLYFQGKVRLQWSVIVSACLFPVTVAILFMYFRTRDNKELQKIFHT